MRERGWDFRQKTEVFQAAALSVTADTLSKTQLAGQPATRIAGATGADIKLRAERKLGGRAKPWPHTGSVSSSALAARSGPWNTPFRSWLGKCLQTCG